MLRLSLCGTEDTSQSTGCLLKAQSDMRVTVLAGHSGSGPWQVLILDNCVTVCFAQSHQHSCCSCLLAAVFLQFLLIVLFYSSIPYVQINRMYKSIAHLISPFIFIIVIVYAFEISSKSLSSFFLISSQKEIIINFLN